jgi:Mg-chelatase subunit ChlD
MWLRAQWTAVLLLAALTLPASPARSEPRAAVQLVLAVDASGSVDTDRYMLQKHGYAEAFRSSAVKAAIRGTPTGAIAVAMLQWTGPALQVVVVDWMLIDSDAAADAFATAVDAAPRALFGGGTSLSGAIDFALPLLARAPFPASRRVIDISGDGANNRGREVEAARDEAVQQGVTINGLPILTLEPTLDA